MTTEPWRVTVVCGQHRLQQVVKAGLAFPVLDGGIHTRVRVACGCDVNIVTSEQNITLMRKRTIGEAG